MKPQPVIKVGVTGGIGSGKSTVCRMFSMLGVAVYDSDAKAKELMEYDTVLAGEIKNAFGKEAYSGNSPDRAFLAEKVFADKTALTRLNSLVHPAVMSDFNLWAAAQESPYVILESAIILDAGLGGYLKNVITVSSPQEVRIERTIARDNSSRLKVEARIANQLTDLQREAMADYVIRNDEKELVWPQVLELDRIFRSGIR